MSARTDKHRFPTSPITPAHVAQAMAGIGEPRLFEGTLYWLENRPGEGGRVTLIQLDGGVQSELTPAPYNVKSRVHEYGGAAYLPGRDAVFFVNAKDQDIYAVDSAGAISGVTRTGADVRYADLCLDGSRGRLIAVTETHKTGRHPLNALAAVDIGTGQATILHQGHDFYASPRVSPSGREILFVVWDHPNMPWDGTQLVRATLQDTGIGETTLVAGGAAESVLQPSWLSDDAALYLSDATGYWNLHRMDSTGTSALLADAAEYAGPPWQFSARDYASLNDRYVVARRQDQGRTVPGTDRPRVRLCKPVTG